MAAADRSRTGSDLEESLVSKFIDATVNFQSNVTFPTAEAETLAPRVLVLMPQQVEATVQPPFWNDECGAARTDASPGTVFSTTVEIKGQRTRLNIGVVPSQASRHNCPVRPDVISTLTEGALGNGKKSDALDVFVALPAGHEAAVAQAVAKGANRSFTAKGGKWDTAFAQAGVPVRVFFNDTSRCEDFNHIATGVQLAMRLGDAPPCLLDTVTFAEIARKASGQLGCGYDEIRGEDLRERGYGGVYGVGKAAEFPPALVTLTYKPKEGIAPKDKIALVGKGIIYDTGGLSIKTPSTTMSTMKFDMCGAGAVFAGFVTLVRLNAPYEIVATLCLADNAIGPRAQRPDDVIVQKSGVTTEIANTDAEGRLVLADGVFHVAQEISGFRPSVIVDMATLTNAQFITTGRKHAAIFSTSEEWETALVAAGKASGEVCFPILYCPEFHNPQYESKVADFKNLCTRMDAVSSCAGMFMTNNLPRDFQGAHVHIDMCGPARGAGTEVATGYGVALLASVFGA